MATTTFAQLFGTSTAFTLNATAWANAVTISTNAVDISAMTPIPDDLMITLLGTFPNSAPAGQKAINVWIAISEDGTHYSDHDQYAGTNNTQTALRAPTNFLGPYIVIINQNVVFSTIIPSFRQLCGGILPRKFGLILENQGGQTITSPSASYTAINFTNA